MGHPGLEHHHQSPDYEPASPPPIGLHGHVNDDDDDDDGCHLLHDGFVEPAALGEGWVLDDSGNLVSYCVDGGGSDDMTPGLLGPSPSTSGASSATSSRTSSGILTASTESYSDRDEEGEREGEEGILTDMWGLRLDEDMEEYHVPPSQCNNQQNKNNDCHPASSAYTSHSNNNRRDNSSVEKLPPQSNNRATCQPLSSSKPFPFQSVLHALNV